jgi:hypothetical protein
VNVGRQRLRLLRVGEAGRGGVRRIALGLVCFAVAMSAVVVVAKAVSDRNATWQPPATRPAAYRPCASVVLTSLPKDFRLTERQLKALPENHMGVVETFTSGSLLVRVYSGVDVLDVLEDLELAGRGVEAGGKTFVLYHTQVQPDLLVGTLEDARLTEPCDAVAVLTRNVRTDAMLGLLSGLEVRERADIWGVGDREQE